MNEQNPSAFLSQYGAVLVRYAALADILDHLLLGIEDRKVVFITYRLQRSAEPVTYDVHPYCLTRHRDTLYLLGFKREDGAFRTWKVNRIEAAEVDSMAFVRRADFNVQQYSAGALGDLAQSWRRASFCRFSAQVARCVHESQWHPSQQCEQQINSSLLVRLELSGTTEIKSWILSFGQHAEVLEPEELQDEITGELAACLDNYGADTSHTKPRKTGPLRKAR